MTLAIAVGIFVEVVVIPRQNAEMKRAINEALQEAQNAYRT